MTPEAHVFARESQLIGHENDAQKAAERQSRSNRWFIFLAYTALVLGLRLALDDDKAKTWLVIGVALSLLMGFLLPAGAWLAHEGVLLTTAAAALLVLWQAPSTAALREWTVLAACAAVVLTIFLVSGLTHSTLIPSISQ
jgi:hypothetical protein